jgi:hypothetical protein
MKLPKGVELLSYEFPELTVLADTLYLRISVGHSRASIWGDRWVSEHGEIIKYFGFLDPEEV